MNTNHAFGFLLVGTIFGLLPRFTPGWCPPTGFDGTSGRELWLQVMSTVLIAVAVWQIAGRVWVVLASMLRYDPRGVTVPAVVETPVAAEEIVVPVARPAIVTRRRERGILPVPVAAFRGGLVEQRRAA